MGLFSWIGGCISSAASFVGSAVRSVGSAIGRVASKVAGFAGKVLTTVASVGEKVIKTVKTVWPVVKPWVAKFSGLLNGIPYVGPFLAKAAKVLLTLDKSPILKKIGQIAERVLPKAKMLGQALTKWSDIQKARQEQEELEEAEAEMENNEQRSALRLTEFINKFIIVNSTITKLIEEDKVTDLESYLRIRADARILEKMKDKLENIKSIDEVSADDLFILGFTDKITNEKDVTEEEADRFSDLVEKMFGKSVMAIVFDEMIKQWEADLNMDRAKKADAFNALNKAKTTFNRCQRLEKAGDATAEDIAEMKQLQKKIPNLEKAHEDLIKAIGHRQDYIEAAEGMLRVYEGDDSLAEIVGEDIDIIKDNVEEVGMVVISCMNRGKQWEELNEEEKGLITDFSNIFRKAAAQRSKDIVTTISVAG